MSDMIITFYQSFNDTHNPTDSDFRIIKQIFYINKFIIIEISYFSSYSAQKTFSVPTN